jgi:osmotically-inducible protein OsmY
MNTKQAVDRVGGLIRTVARRAERLGRRGGSFAAGKASALTNRSGPKAGMDDQTLKSKVESEVFRAADAPKGSVDVTVVAGVVELRGEVKRPEDKKDLEAKVRSIPEVRDVNNLVHLPKTPAPGRTQSA